MYALNMKGKRLHNPLHMFTADKPNLHMLAAILMASLAAMLDTIAIRGFESTVLQFYEYAGCGADIVRVGAPERRSGTASYPGSIAGACHCWSAVWILVHGVPVGDCQWATGLCIGGARQQYVHGRGHRHHLVAREIYAAEAARFCLYGHRPDAVRVRLAAEVLVEAEQGVFERFVD